MCRVNNPASGLPDISIRQLEYLVAVAEAPTWAAAADRVGVSASALSQGLAELERRVGVELFESVGRRRILRATVTPVLEHARQVLALTRDVSTWAERLRTAQSGRVRLGMIDVAAVVHFPDVLRTFRAERIDVEFMLSVAPSRSLLDDVQRGALDLAVCVEPPEPIVGVDTTSLLSEPMIVYGPPDSTIGAPSSWGPWVLFPSDSHTRRLVVERLSALGAPVTVAAESHQPDVLREMVLLGLGWTVLPRSQGESERGAMTVGDQILERKLVLARRAGVVTDPAVDELAHRLQTRPTAD
jgi:DNA-binding transcriptional LysR family regulator|tara:strand:- start:176 stop:1072 length:897 start_codon:yes stop_codon:yes gene_type:complete